MNPEELTKEMSDDLYKFLLKRSKAKGEYYKGKNVHVSGLDSCVRAVVMEAFDFPKKELTLAQLLMFEIADFIHRLMLNWASQSKNFKLIGGERNLSEGLPEGVSGKCDIILEHKKDNLRILLDTKTAMPAAFKTYSDYLVKESHKLQGASYKLALENLGEIIDFVIFTYFDRGGTNSPVYALLPEIPEFILKDKFNLYRRAILDYEKDKLLPDKEPPIFTKKGNKIMVKKSWVCDYCAFCSISCEGYPELDRKKEIEADMNNPELVLAYQKAQEKDLSL